MSDGKTTIKNGFEELLNKSIEASKVFISEGTRIVKQFGGKDNNVNIGSFQTDMLTNAFNEYVKLNVNHMSNLMDLGLNFMKTISGNADVQTNTQSEQLADEPGFILEGSAEQGQGVNFQFLLDNIKAQTAFCQLIHSDYILQPDGTAKSFETTFSPQSFEVKPGESKPVKISITIPDDAVPGFYESKVQVKGFEPAFFSIQLTVTEKKTKPTANA